MDRRHFLASAAYALGVGAFPARRAFAQQTRALDAGAFNDKLTPPASDLIRVACTISKGTTEIDYVGPMAVFETWHRAPGSNRPAPRFKIFTVSETREPVDGRIADYTFSTAPLPQVVVVPAQSGSPALLEWLRRVHHTADVTMSVCIGARQLAKAGLLDGKRATTHHEAIDRLEKEFTAVKWVRGVRFVENGNISTAGGLTAGNDLALRVVERYFGRDAALAVVEHLEYDGKRWMTG